MPESNSNMHLRLEPIEGARDIKTVTLTERGVLVVGRSSSTHLRLPKFETNYSRLHFVLEFNPPKCRLLDLGSRMGTYVNGQKTFTAYLKDGDEIRAGSTTFRVTLAPGLAGSKPAKQRAEKAAKPEEEPPGSADDLAYYSLDKERDKKLAARKAREKKSKKKQKSAGQSKSGSAGNPSVDTLPAPAANNTPASVAPDSSKGLKFDLEKLLDGEDSSAGSESEE